MTTMNSFSKFDDGGAAKSGDRRRRRRFRGIITKISVAISGIFLLIIVCHFHTQLHTTTEIKNSILTFRGVGGKNKQKLLTKQRHDNMRRKGQEDGERQRDLHPKPKYRWANPLILPTPPHSNLTYEDPQIDYADDYRDLGRDLDGRRGGRAKRVSENLVWDDETVKVKGLAGPKVDYTKIKYDYPEQILIPPRGGAYPPMEPLGDVIKRWPQDDIDSPPQPYKEQLQHFDYLDPIQMEAAIKYRDLEFPFKVYNVPEINAATKKWTDEYLSHHFDNGHKTDERRVPRTHGHCQQSVDSFFAFFYEERWNKQKLGPSPTLNNDFTFERFAKHARYADAVGLASNEEHFYWQAGVPPEERNQPKKKWGMISRDLPSFSSPHPTFFGFNPKAQKGIQCRLGERGVAAATHYDGGRNMIAMITGAKRYILSPPNECRKLGIIPEKRHPIFRHSLLNFGHINMLDSDDLEVRGMSSKEREWLEISSSANTIETVLKAGEVLYLPSHWFHYIVSLQKSAQCNTRSGRHEEGSPEWGGMDVVVNECLKSS